MTLAAAQSILSLGVRPIPVPYRTKSPVLDKWQDLILDADDLPQYFNGRPANVGGLMGEPSQGIVDIDLDCSEAVAVASYLLPATLTFGRASRPASHRLYRCIPCGRTRKFVGPAPERAMVVELRSTGAQTVMPGSVHPSGEAVEWGNYGAPIADTDAYELETAVARVASAALLARYWPGEGSRHEAALALAGGLLRAVWTVADAQAFIRAVVTAAGDCETEDRVRCVSSTRSRLDDGEETSGWRKLASYVNPEAVKLVRKWLCASDDEQQSFRGATAPENDTGPQSQTRPTQPPGDDDDLPTFQLGDHAEIADFMLTKLSRTKDHLIHDEGSIWRYQPATGHWEAIPLQTMQRIVKGFSGAPVYKGVSKSGADRYAPLHITASIANGASELAAAEVAAPGFFDDAPFGVAFSNGYLRIDPSTGAIAMTQHAPANRARVGFQFPWEESVSYPMLSEFMDELFGDCSEEERAARVMGLQEFCGAAMFGLGPSYQRCCVALGDGGRGKSQFADIVRSIYPGPSIASLPPHRWGDKFSLSCLVGAFLNIVGELPSAELTNTETFKAVITGDPLTAERKYAPAFGFKPRAAHLFNANRLPPTTDITEGFFRRFLIVPFTRDMRAIPSSRPDAAKAVIQAEHRGIVSWAVEGACRLVRQRRYTENQSGLAILEGWRRDSDSVASFVAERCNRLTDGEEWSLSSRVYKSYKEWAIDSGYRAVSIKTFSSRLEANRIFPARRAGGVYVPLEVKVGYGA